MHGGEAAVSMWVEKSARMHASCIRQSAHACQCWRCIQQSGCMGFAQHGIKCVLAVLRTRSLFHPFVRLVLFNFQ